MDLQAEIWSHLYRYPVVNGIYPAMISLAKHIPSHLTVADQRVLVSYDKQTMPCCETGHLYQARPRQPRLQEKSPISTPVSLADIAARGRKTPCRQARTKRGQHGTADSQSS